LEAQSKLSDLQRLIYRLITAPEGLEASARGGRGIGLEDIAAIVPGDARLDSLERLKIYATAYFYRLLNCLKEDYPATLAVLSERRFEKLVRDYLAAHPPTEPSIQHAGKALPGYLRGHQYGIEQPYLEDLARLERTIIDVFHGADATPIERKDLESISAAQWPAIQFRTLPSVTILDCKWRVGKLLHAAAEGEPWDPPEQAQATVLVWRQHFTVYHREIERSEACVLKLAEQPVAFARLCEEISRTTDDPVAQIAKLLDRWIADGLLSAVLPGG
jgi:hypothetical protein